MTTRTLWIAGLAACGGTSAGPTVELVASLPDVVDTAPTGDGSVSYALTPTEVVRVSGGTIALHAGAPLRGASGLAVSADDATLFVADPVADTVFTVSAADGSVFGEVGAARGRTPRAGDVGGDTLLVAGAVDGQPAIVAIAAGVATTIARGAPLVEPSGIAAVGPAEAYVTDAIGHVVHVAGGQASVLGGTFAAGSPAGTALLSDGSLVLSSALSARGTAEIVFTETADGTQTTFDDVIGQNLAAGGLHRAARARNPDVLSWAGLGHGVYEVKIPPTP